ncbi:hypothetical protein MKW92_042560 [Papaver armeniacum]|nr:hypothetical protein MKW92_042560 [Papaver armeniacum]
MAIHVAAGRSEFVEELVKIMPLEALEFKETKDGDTVLHLAAVSGITEAAKAIVKVNPRLTQMCNDSGWVPLLSAASYVSSSSKEHQKEMVEYLYSVTRDDNPSPFKDIPLSLVEQYPDLPISTDDGICALEVLAQQPTAFLSGSHLAFSDRLIYKYIQVESPSTCQIRHYAIEGDVENPPEIPGDHFISKRVIAKFLNVTSMTRVLPAKILQRYYKILKTKKALALVKCILARISQMSASDISNFFTKSDIQSKFARYGNIFKLIYENVDQKLLSFQDESGNTILHLAAKLAPLSRLKTFGSEVFQMQQEMLWFTEKQQLKTAYELFTEEHNELMQKAEIWAKGTAESSMLVASLVATIVFAAAIIVPCGTISDSSNKDNGIPIFLLGKALLVFVVADALAFFSSITSAMMFITVLTSRYTELDFLISLPQKIILNLMSLSFSISAMIVTFSVALSIILVRRFSGAIVPITLLAAVPVNLFVYLVLPLLAQMFFQTYCSWDMLKPIRKKKTQFITRKSIRRSSVILQLIQP